MTVITRIRDFHRCQEGGVQSLALVMTFPAFVGSVLLLVQLAQVLIGVLTVQYAAFASARSAAVWLSASVQDQQVDQADATTENELPFPIRRGEFRELTPELLNTSRKLREIQGAAVQACVAISPARFVPGPRYSPEDVQFPVDAFLAFQSLTSDPRIDRWRTAATNRWSYASANTRVRLAFLGQPASSPTYNPIGHPRIPRNDSEAAWDDSVTVVVQHEVSLVPGPGRWLFQQATWGRVPANQTELWTTSGRQDRVPVIASATMVLPGIQSLRPLSYPWRGE